jgi:hypothetical protein
MKILFLHGWQSTPGGVKPTFLKDHGHTVLNPLLAVPVTRSGISLLVSHFPIMTRSFLGRGCPM